MKRSCGIGGRGIVGAVRVAAVITLLAFAAVACGGAGASEPQSPSQPPSGPAATTPPAAAAAAVPTPSAVSAGNGGDVAYAIPGVGADYMAKLPANTMQVVVAQGDGINASTGTISWWRKTADGWQKVRGDVPTHNGTRGWSGHHMQGDLRTPIGVYTLTNAGGLLPNPETKMPYETKDWYYGDVIGTSYMGQPLDNAFHHVVAIDYNRVPGSPPSDKRKPMGAARGGGIWLHVDHISPTHGCISLPRPDIKALVQWLDPAAHPAIVMGPAAILAG